MTRRWRGDHLARRRIDTMPSRHPACEFGQTLRQRFGTLRLPRPAGPFLGSLREFFLQ